MAYLAAVGARVAARKIPLSIIDGKFDESELTLNLLERQSSAFLGKSPQRVDFSPKACWAEWRDGQLNTAAATSSSSENLRSAELWLVEFSLGG